MGNGKVNILGIDPGVDGALFLLSDYQPLDVILMPIGKSHHGKNRIDRGPLLGWLDGYDIDYAFLERFQRGKLGGEGFITTVVNYDTLRDVLAMAGIPLAEVGANSWQAHCKKVGGGKGKLTAFTFARYMGYTPRPGWYKNKRKPAPHMVPHDGEIDAFCIASYGYTKVGGL